MIQLKHQSLIYLDGYILKYEILTYIQVQILYVTRKNMKYTPPSAKKRIIQTNYQAVSSAINNSHEVSS